MTDAKRCAGCRCVKCRWRGAGSSCCYNEHGVESSRCSYCRVYARGEELAAMKTESYLCKGYQRKFEDSPGQKETGGLLLQLLGGLVDVFRDKALDFRCRGCAPGLASGAEGLQHIRLEIQRKADIGLPVVFLLCLIFTFCHGGLPPIHPAQTQPRSAGRPDRKASLCHDQLRRHNLRRTKDRGPNWTTCSCS